METNLFDMLERMLRERIAYHESRKEFDSSNAYSSALVMFQYARDDCYEGLANFDYYGELK